MGESMNLVPIGAFHGRGKHTGFFGLFLLACYDVDKKEYQSICKIGYGFSDAVIQERSASLSSKVIATPKKNYRVNDIIKPDVWFEPAEVWEVTATDFTLSALYRAATGILDPVKGVSLRFARLVCVQEDKKPEEATSSHQVAEMFQAWKRNQPSNDQAKIIHNYPSGLSNIYIRIYEIVDDPSFDSIISWSKSNNSFIIWNQEKLIHRSILKRFHCTNFSSFLSSLHVFGFRRVKGSEMLEFGNANFVRGKPELLKKMQSKNVSKRLKKRLRAKKATEEVEDRLQHLRI